VPLFLPNAASFRLALLKLPRTWRIDDYSGGPAGLWDLLNSDMGFLKQCFRDSWSCTGFWSSWHVHCTRGARMSSSFTRVGHYHAGKQTAPSIDPPTLRSHWRESPQGTANNLVDVVDQWARAKVPLLTTRPAIDAQLDTGSHAAGRQVSTQWDSSVGTRHLFREGIITRQLDGHTRQQKTAMTFRGPCPVPNVAGPGPSTNSAVSPVARVPGVTRPVSMIIARTRVRRPLQLTAQCEQDRDH